MTATPKIIAEQSAVALQVIRPHIELTPLKEWSLSNGNRIFLKLENRQHTGSFKARGSLNKIQNLVGSDRPQEVVTASTGNHALGVARALQITGLKGTIVLPGTASQEKIKKLQAYDVHLEMIDGSSLDAELYGKALAEQTVATWISPYNDLEIIAGQGTIGLEICAQLDNFQRIYVTVGGGGLMAGIASTIKQNRPDCTIIGCQPENSPEMTLSVEKGEIVDFPPTPTLSDGSAGGIESGAITFPICQSLVDRFALVTENEIEAAIKLVYQKFNEVIEGAAGVAVAVAIRELSAASNTTAIVVICGGNIEQAIFQKIIHS